MPLRSSAELERLLAHASYVRSLARELVLDAHLRKDVEQEVWLAALESAPRDAGALRGWLAVLVRNFAIKAWRSGARRSARELACARGEAGVPRPEEILEREDLRRALVEAVLALEEPYRSALILRFLEEATPREVARRLGVPVETARTRIKRGLELLRQRLDRGEGGRGAWCLVLVRGLRIPVDPLRVAAALAESSWSGVLLMSLLKKASIAAGLIVLALAGMRFSRGTEQSAPLDTRADPAAILAAGRDTLGADVEPPVSSPAASPPTRSAAAPASAPLAPLVEEGAALLLRTTWEDGTPAAGIAGTLHCSGAEDFYADAIDFRTGADGSCRIESLPPGRVSAFLDRGPYGGAEVAPGGATELEIAIPRGFTVEGVVLADDEQPIAAAEVYLAINGPTADGHVVTSSDSQGRFRVRSASDGICWLSARAPLRSPTPQLVLVGGEGGTLAVTLRSPGSGGEVEGIVRDAAGQPIAGACVLVGEETSSERVPQLDGRQAAGPAGQRVFTDPGGRFRVAGAPPGTLPVRVRSRGFAAWLGQVEVGAGLTSALEVTLGSGVWVQGTVTDAASQPVSGAEVSVGAGFTGRVTYSGEDGSFLLQNLAHGEFEIRVDAEARGRASATLFGKPGVGLRWDPVLDAGASIRGRIVLPGLDPSRCEIHVEPVASRGAPWQRVRPDALGVFEVTGLPDGEVRLEVIAAEQFGFPIATVLGVEPGGEELVIEIDPLQWPSVRLRGRVIDGQGRALSGIPILPHRAGAGWVLLTTEADGTFDFGPYPPGKWSVRIRPPGAVERQSETVELTANQTWDFGDLRQDL